MNVAIIIARESGHRMGADVQKQFIIVFDKPVLEHPDEIETTRYSKEPKARLDGSKAKSLDWKAKYTIETRIEKTMEVLKRREAI